MEYLARVTITQKHTSIPGERVEDGHLPLGLPHEAGVEDEVSEEPGVVSVALKSLLLDPLGKARFKCFLYKIKI